MVPTIVIVGGGFSGVSLTHALSRLPWPRGVRIAVADRSGHFGRGAAYSTDHPAHLLNVPAGRMGALADNEGHFLGWLRTTNDSIAGDAFVPRSQYGDYLEHLFDETRRSASPNISIETISEEATALTHDGDGAHVHFGNPKKLRAERVVLAIGNLPPRNLSAVDPALLDDARYVPDPWEPGALKRIGGTKSVLLIGTGLTMVDAVLSLYGAASNANFVAVSRHGLLPLSHRDWPTRPVVIEPSPKLEQWNGFASALLRIIRDEARAAERAGLDWRDVINGLRPVTHLLWRRMPPREQARFHRHVRPFWDTHRHRMSTRVASAINGLIARKQLAIVAGRIAACARDGDRVAVDVRRRDGQTMRHDVDAVVNCTGPCSDLSYAGDPLVADLRSSGLIVPDVLGIGIHTGDDGAVIDRNGKKSETIFTLGGTRRPGLWESTAVPELRAQADALARRLHHSLHHAG